MAHFFRRAFDLTRKRGAFGLIATNTIAQGDTRASGLRWICKHGGEIFSVRRRVKWPGSAAVVVSVLHIGKGSVSDGKRLNGCGVGHISAFLFHRGGHDDPVRLSANARQSFQGSIVLGMGFTFDDTDQKGVASSLAEMRRLTELDPRNKEVIFPYLGGQEVNASPTHAHHRYVIDFGELTEPECRGRWPALMKIVEQRVRPERSRKDARKYPRMVHEWWKHWNARPELRCAIGGLPRVLVVSRVGRSAAFTFVPAPMVYADSLVVFPLTTYAAFCVLQSRVHDVWIRFFGSSMKDDLRYTPSDCFETFPMPAQWKSDPCLDAPGREFHRYRAALMRQSNQGLTSMYSNFHSPNDTSEETQKLRDLQSEMDDAVLRAFGWADLHPECRFRPDPPSGTPDDLRETWSYRWDDRTREEILTRLVELNGKRAAQEAMATGARRNSLGKNVGRGAGRESRGQRWLLGGHVGS